MRLVHLPILIALCLVAAGCTRRTITVTSEPSGALCWLNGREIGRTPVTVDFLYYGIYDVQLVSEGYEPLLTTGRADAPLWDHVPLDLISEITPPEKHVKIEWHYTLAPEDNDPAALVSRARELQSRIAALEGHDAAEAAKPAPPPLTYPTVPK